MNLPTFSIGRYLSCSVRNVCRDIFYPFLLGPPRYLRLSNALKFSTLPQLAVLVLPSTAVARYWRALGHCFTT